MLLRAYIVEVHSGEGSILGADRPQSTEATRTRGTT